MSQGDETDRGPDGPDEGRDRRGEGIGDNIKGMSGAFRKAVQRGVQTANRHRREQALPPLPTWTPYQLRHSAATRIRAEHGIEAARVLLGHTSAAVTEIYAEADLQAAARVAEQAG